MRAKASRTQAKALTPAFNHKSSLLNVRLKPTVSLPIGMAYIVPCTRVSATHFTNCHS